MRLLFVIFLVVFSISFGVGEVGPCPECRRTGCDAVCPTGEIGDCCRNRLGMADGWCTGKQAYCINY